MTLVTGASSEIGRSLARRKELLDSLVGEIEAAGGRALAIACDVTDGEAVPARGA